MWVALVPGSMSPTYTTTPARAFGALRSHWGASRGIETLPLTSAGQNGAVAVRGRGKNIVAMITCLLHCRDAATDRKQVGAGH